mgnify:FL=1
MRKVFKFVAITAFTLEYVLLVGLFSLAGIANYRNRTKYATDSLYVSIKADYKEKFINQEFSPEDFGVSYVEYIGYRFWVDGNPDEGETGHGVIYVKLKSNDRFHYKKAVRSFESLPFVLKTEKNWIFHAY